MTSSARVAAVIGSGLSVIALIGSFLYERHMYGQPNIDSTALTATLVIGAVVFGLLTAAGLYAGLRLAGIRQVSYRFGSRFALAYIALVAAINLIPMTITIQSDDWRAATSGLLVFAVCGLALPALLAYVLVRFRQDE